MNSKRLIYAFILSFILTVFPKVSSAGDENIPVFEDPSVFIKNTVDACIDILRSEKNKDLQKEKILNLMKTSFDFSNITEDLLSGLEVTDKDKSAFNEVFPLLLEIRYRMFVKSPDNFSVEYNGHKIFFSDSKAIVYTRAKISYNDIVLNYKLHHHDADGKWKIYDITADGVSMMSNYRAQIHKTLTRMSFPDLLTHLEKMVGKKTNRVDIVK